MTATAQVKSLPAQPTPVLVVPPSPKATRPGSIERSEIKFLAVFTALICLLTSVPYVAGHLLSFPGTVFTDVLDHSLDENNYLAYTNQAASGSWLFRNPMTGEPHSAVFFNLEWLMAGKMAVAFHISPAAALNVQRLLCLILLCGGVYWLSSFLLQSRLLRRIALVATMAGGGFGWIAAVHLLHIPLDSSYFLDLTNANLFPFYWALKLPHFLVSESFIVLGFCFFLLAERDGLTRYYAATALCYLAAGSCRPYDMLFAMAATSLYLACQAYKTGDWRGVIGIRALPVWLCMPLLGYFFWIFKLHPVFRWWSFPGRPAPAAYLLALAFGMSFVGLVVAIWRLRREHLSDAAQFVVCCLITAILLAHTYRVLHFSFQFATDIFVPMVMIALVGLEKPILRWKERRPWATGGIVALLVVNSFTSIALAGQAVVLVAKGDFRDDSQMRAAYSWLNAHSQPWEVVLADFETSNEIPAHTRSSVFCGYLNTVRLDQKLKEQRQFFDPAVTNGYREDLIRVNAIHFVLLTAAEDRSLAEAGAAGFLTEVFRNDAAVIFAVNDSSAKR